MNSQYLEFCKASKLQIHMCKLVFYLQRFVSWKIWVCCNSMFLTCYIRAAALEWRQKAETLTLQNQNKGIAAQWPVEDGGFSSMGLESYPAPPPPPPPHDFPLLPLPVPVVCLFVPSLCMSRTRGGGGGLCHLSADIGHVLRQWHWFYWLINLWFSHTVGCL